MNFMSGIFFKRENTLYPRSSVLFSSLTNQILPSYPVSWTENSISPPSHFFLPSILASRNNAKWLAWLGRRGRKISRINGNLRFKVLMSIAVFPLFSWNQSPAREHQQHYGTGTKGKKAEWRVGMGRGREWKKKRRET